MCVRLGNSPKDHGQNPLKSAALAHRRARLHRTDRAIAPLTVLAAVVVTVCEALESLAQRGCRICADVAIRPDGSDETAQVRGTRT
jgi:hypothetical protein